MNRISRRTRVARPLFAIRAALAAALVALLFSANAAAAGPQRAAEEPAHASPATPSPKIARKQRKGAEPKDQPAEAAEFFLEKRMPASERAKPRGQRQLPVERYVEARERARGLPRFSTQEARFIAPWEPEVNARAAQWTALGPGNVGGRTRTIAFDPNNANTMYAGGVAGGVWKTTDGGTSWTALGDIMSNMAVTAIVVDRTNSNRIYAGTGEGFFNIDAVRGAGIFVSEDAGVTWTQMATTNNSNFHHVMRLVQSPNDANVFYAGTRNGLWRTLDRGATAWTQQISAPNANGCTDFEVRTDVTPDTAIASCGQFAPASNETGIYRSAAANTATPAWSRRVGPAAASLALSSMGRASIAIAPSAQGTMYALVSCSRAVATDCGSGTYSNGVLGVYRSTDGGTSWVAQFTNAFGTGNGIPFGNLLLSNPVIAQCGLCQSACGIGATNQFLNQGWYDNEIAVDPADATIVWAGGIDLMRSNDSGASWGLASYWWFFDTEPEYAHADQHLIRFHPNYNGTTNQTMFVGDDGGIYRNDNARAAVSGPPTASQATNPVCGSQNLPAIAWDNLNNGYGVTQFYHGTVYPNGQTYFGGTQDNGTNRGSDAAGANAWTEIVGGDGGYVATDPTTSGGSRVLYAETTAISIRKSTNDGASFLGATSGITNTSCGLFINPFTIDPNTPSRLWTSHNVLWRTDNAAGAWTQASTALSGTSCAVGGGSERYSSHAVAPGDSNLLLAGTSQGRICRLTTATTATNATAPTCVTPNGANYVSSVAFDPNNTGNQNTRIAYATFSSFGVPHVWRSANGGQTWASIDGAGANALPDVPAHSVVVHPAEANTIWVGTDIGIFVTIDGGANWNRENSGFANVITEHLQLNDSGATGRELFAFTHGRGAFRAAVQQDQAIAINDTFNVNGNSGANTLAVLANDVAQQGTGTLNVVSATDPPHGTTSVGVGGANVLYTPDTGYCSGPDFFHYTINGSDSALVSVSVGTCPADVPPTAVADAATVLEDSGATAVNVLVNDTDPDGGPKTIQSVTQPANGAVVITGGGTGLTYAPTANACNNGSPLDTFTYTLNGGSSTTVSMTVTCVNDAPGFTKGADQTVLEDAGAQSVSGWATAISAGPANESSQTVSFAITNNTNAALFSAGPAVAANGTLTYTPAANANGTATITLRIADNGGTANGGVDQSATQTFVVNVTPVNDAPSFTKGADQTSNEDAGAQSVSGWATAISAGAGEGSQVVSFAITNNTNPGLFSAGPAVASNGTLSYTAAANASGAATITLRIADNGGTANGGVDQSATQTFVINVNAVNDAPSFTKGADQTVLEDAGAQSVSNWATAISPGPADESGQTVSFAITGNTNAALFSAAPAVASNGTLTYTAASDASGAATITLRINDNGGTANGGIDQSATQTFVINVTGINDAPSFTKGADQTVDEDAGAQSVTNWATAISAGPSEAAQVVSFAITNNTNAALFSAGPAVAANGTLTFTPAANANGTATITLRITDNGGTANGGVDASPTQAFVVTITPIDDAPVAVANAATVLEDAAASAIDVLTNDTDVDGGTKSIQSATDPANGTVAITGGGTGLTYAPDPNFCSASPDTFQYTLNGGSSAAVSVTVTCVNDAPSFTAGANQTVTENSGAQSVSGWATAISAGPANEAGQIVSFEIVSNSNPTLFSAVPAVAANGTLTYTSATDAFGVATLQVRALDNGGTASGGINASAAQTFTITVTDGVAPNQPPVANDDTPAAVLEDASATTFAVLANDTDAEADPFVVTAVTQPANGTAAIGPAGANVTFTPAADFCGATSFTYTITGGDTATVSVTVTCVNDAPVLNDRSVTIGAGAANGTLLALLAALDVDSASLTYSITNGNTGGAFTVNPTTGAITVATTGAVQTINSPIVLVVTVSDGTLTDTATITITISPDGIFSDGFE